MSDGILVARRPRCRLRRREGACSAQRRRRQGAAWRRHPHRPRAKPSASSAKAAPGKTTLGRALLRLVDVTAGSIGFDGRDITASARSDDAAAAAADADDLSGSDGVAQSAPHDPPHRGRADAVSWRRRDEADAEARVRQFFDRFTLPLACLDRYPHELSGGQRQRVGIARAALLAPDFVLADEIVSGLDVSTQAQVLNLLKDTVARPRARDGVHQPRPLGDPRGLRPRLCDAQRPVVEEGRCEDVFAAPKSAYTRALIDAIPLPEIDPDWLDRNPVETVTS